MVRIPTPSWALRLGCHEGRVGMLAKGWGQSELGIYNPTHPSISIPCGLFPLPVLCLGPGLRPPLFLRPGPSVTVSTSLDDGPDPLLPPPGSGRLPASLFQSLPSIPPGGLQSGPIATF